jgi:hypothetical protein
MLEGLQRFPGMFRGRGGGLRKRTMRKKMAIWIRERTRRLSAKRMNSKISQPLHPGRAKNECQTKDHRSGRDLRRTKALFIVAKMGINLELRLQIIWQFLHRCALL